MYLFSSKITHKNIKPEGQQGSEALTAARVLTCIPMLCNLGRTKWIGIKIRIEVEIVASDGIKNYNRNYSQIMELELK